MESRENDLQQLKIYTEGVDKELTMILQSLQWDRTDLTKATAMVTCKFDTNHRIPSEGIKKHEDMCFLKQQGYFNDTSMLPEPPDTSASTLVKLSSEDILNIIEDASKSNPLFKKVFEIIMALKIYIILFIVGAEPLSLARLQATYTADERRAIHEAVVSAVPSCHDLADLALLSSKGNEQKESKTKSRVEILAELRDMRRRRTKYRVAAKTRNYSDVLRDVIRTQMEFYNDLHSDTPTVFSKENTEANTHADNKNTDHAKQRTNTHYSNEHSRHYVNDDYMNRSARDFRWGSECKRDGSMQREHSRHKEKSRERGMVDKRDRYITSKREDESKTSRNSNYIEDKTSKTYRYASPKDRRYDDRAGRSSNERRVHRTDTDKSRQHDREESFKIGERSKYDKYKSRHGKRHYEERWNRAYTKEGIASHSHEKYKK